MQLTINDIWLFIENHGIAIFLLLIAIRFLFKAEITIRYPLNSKNCNSKE